MRSGHRTPSSPGPSGTTRLPPCRQPSSQRDGERHVASASNVGSYYCEGGKTNGWHETGTGKIFSTRATQGRGEQGLRSPLSTCTSMQPSTSSIFLSVQPSSPLFFQPPVHSMDVSSYHPTIIYPPSTALSFHPSVHLVIHSATHSSKGGLLSPVLAAGNAAGTREMWFLPSGGVKPCREDRRQVITRKY